MASGNCARTAHSSPTGHRRGGSSGAWHAAQREAFVPRSGRAFFPAPRWWPGSFARLNSVDGVLPGCVPFFVTRARSSRSHDKFQRGKPHLLSQIKRATHYETTEGAAPGAPASSSSSSNSSESVDDLRSEVTHLRSRIDELTDTLDHLSGLVEQLLHDDGAGSSRLAKKRKLFALRSARGGGGAPRMHVDPLGVRVKAEDCDDECFGDSDDVDEDELRADDSIVYDEDADEMSMEYTTTGAAVESTI